MDKQELTRSFGNLMAEIGEKNWKDYINVQKELLKGNPLNMEKVANILATSVSEAKQIADQFGELNKQGEVVGFAGLSLVPTNHRFEVNGNSFYTWCAADSLLFPSALGITARIYSDDPVSNQKIELTVSPDKIEKVVPVSAVVSIVETADSCNIRSTLCDRVHFFASESTASEWKKKNKDASIIPVEKLFGIRGILTDTTCC